MKMTKWKQGSFGGTKKNGGSNLKRTKRKEKKEGVEAHEKDQKKTKFMARLR